MEDEDDSGLGFLKTTTEDVKPNFFSRITGAVTGVVGTTGGIVVSAFIGLVLVGLIGVGIRRKFRK